MICNVSDATGQLDSLQLSFFGSRSNRLPVLAPRPSPSAVRWRGSGLDCDPSWVSSVPASVCTCAGFGGASLLDPLWDFLAASLAALAATSICSFALFKV